MKWFDLFLSMGSSPGYLKKIGTNFLVAAGIAALVMVGNISQLTKFKAAIPIVLFFSGILCFVFSKLKMEKHPKHWQQVGEPEMEPQRLRKTGRTFAGFGLVIMLFLLSKLWLLQSWPDRYDITAIVVPFMLAGYLFLKAKKKN